MTSLPNEHIPKTVKSKATVGEILKEARLKNRLNLADLAVVTRIPRNMLENLENNDFHEYTAEVFARGHIISYARELRLDVDKVLQAYERQMGRVRASQSMEIAAIESASGFDPVKALKKQRSKRRRKSSRRKSTSASPLRAKLESYGLKPLHMTAVFLILCAIMAFTLINGNRATAQDPARFQVEEPSAKEGTTSDSPWALEQDTERTKWLLEQPASLTIDSPKR